MSRRKVAVESDDDDMETGQFIPKKTRSNQGMGKRMYEFRRLQDVERFVSKIYWLVILSFMGVGIAMVATLSERTFRDVFMAESLMSTLGITAYVILLLLLLMCHSHRRRSQIWGSTSHGGDELCTPCCQSC